MFDSSIIVQSAISSFNNTALLSPSFFWSALLMFPLFALVYKFGNAFIDQLRWDGIKNPKYRTFNFSLIIEFIILAWLVVMGWNYDVLRDSISWLPFVISGLVFILTASFVQKLRGINPKLPNILQKSLKWRQIIIVFIYLLAIALVGLSGYPTWWGFALQSAAFVCGIIAGRFWSREISPIFLTTAVMFIVSTIILMQPEFFRFGQLGNLTILHLISIMLVGGLAMAVFALRNIKPSGRISPSAFIKIKWMFRIVAGLCLVLFILTESVPVFLGLCAVLLVSFASSVWHSGTVPDALSKKIWALLLCSFGIMTGLGLVTAIGILYWVNLPGGNFWRQLKFLL